MLLLLLGCSILDYCPTLLELALPIAIELTYKYVGYKLSTVTLG
jgi:hypothetical protein